MEPDVATELGVETANLPIEELRPRRRRACLPASRRQGHASASAANVVARARQPHARRRRRGRRARRRRARPSRRHFTAFSPEVSLNFGHRNGWSYISGGMFGRAKLYADRREDRRATTRRRARRSTTAAAPAGSPTSHVAFSVDFRWYSVAEGPLTTATPCRLVSAHDDAAGLSARALQSSSGLQAHELRAKSRQSPTACSSSGTRCVSGQASAAAFAFASLEAWPFRNPWPAPSMTWLS